MRETNVQVAVASGAPRLSPRDVVMPLFRRRRVLLATFAGMFAAIMLLGLVIGPSYSSRMSILVNRERLDPLVTTEATTQLITGNNPVSPEEINSEIELLRSRDVLEQIVIANGRDKRQGFSLIDLLRPGQTREDRIARAVKSLAKQLKIEAIRESNVIEVTYKSGDPQRSYGVLKSLGDAYIAKHVAVHRPAGSYQFFATEASKYHDQLLATENSLRKFDETNAVAAPDAQRTNLSAQIALSVGQLHQAEQAIAADEQRIREDRRQMSATPQRSTTLEASASNDKLIDDINAALLAAETKRTQLVLKYDPSYPLVQEADREIAQDRAAVDQAEQKRYVTETTDRDPTWEMLREDVARSETDLAAQRATRAATERSIQSIQAQMVALDQLSITEHDLRREAQAAESNYLLYLGKREQERSSNALDVTRIANVAIAVPPAIPVLPVLGWPTFILIGLASSAVLGVGAAYVTDYFDPTFHTPEQVTGLLDIPVVIAMPKRIA